MKPRDSIPTTTSTPSASKGAASRSIASRKAVGSFRRVVMSLNRIPARGKSGTSRMYCARSRFSIIFPRQLLCDNIQQLSWHVDHVRYPRSVDVATNTLTVQREGLYVFAGDTNRDSQLVADLPVDLNDDGHHLFRDQALFPDWPGLLVDAVRHS